MTHPYRHAPPHRLWRKAVAAPGFDTDPVADFPFRIAPGDRIMAAGSCFAQHISGRLAQSGYHFLVTETAHPLLPASVAADHHYGRFTARYGNIYTARQLLQLLRRAYGRFAPGEDAWEAEDGTLVDPFRPSIQPGGFVDRDELDADRAQHLAAVRRAFETLDVLVFTLGLTEAWESVRDGAVFPACPGTVAGRFDADRHRFRNHAVTDVVTDLEQFVAELRRINPGARLILTVSPVPLLATATGNHVLVATTYSKSVLRIAAETLAGAHDHVAYFPSYEIITGPQARGRYFAEDLRDVTAEGVDRVMELFFAHATTDGAAVLPPPPSDVDIFQANMRRHVQVLCDENAIDP